jgi:hypothetical protein
MGPRSAKVPRHRIFGDFLAVIGTISNKRDRPMSLQQSDQRLGNVAKCYKMLRETPFSTAPYTGPHRLQPSNEGHGATIEKA